MARPLSLLVTVASLALPVLAAGWRQRTLDRPMRLVVGWYVILAIQNAATSAWMVWIDDTNNLSVPQLFMPVEATFVLLAIAEWQLSPVVRSTVRWSIPCYWVTWSLAIVYIEPLGSFSIFAGPLLALLVLASALVAFIARLQRDVEPALESSWGYILPGLAIFFAINATATIVLAVGYARNDFALMINVSILRGWIYLLATLLITWGFLWPTRHRSSGPSSSRPHSR